MLARAAKLFPVRALNLMADRLGDDLTKTLQIAEVAAVAAKNTKNTHITDFGGGNPLLCECEMVCLAEVECVARDPSTHSLTDIRLRTRLGMGTCQGTFCSLRSVASLVEHGIPLEFAPADSMCRFLQERWKGLRPVLWGQQAREMEFSRSVYAGILNLDGAMHEQNN